MVLVLVPLLSPARIKVEPLPFELRGKVKLPFASKTNEPSAFVAPTFKVELMVTLLGKID